MSEQPLQNIEGVAADAELGELVQRALNHINAAEHFCQRDGLMPQAVVSALFFRMRAILQGAIAAERELGRVAPADLRTHALGLFLDNVGLSLLDLGTQLRERNGLAQAAPLSPSGDSLANAVETIGRRMRDDYERREDLVDSPILLKDFGKLLLQLVANYRIRGGGH